MVAVSGGILFAGYQMLVYGWSQVQGGNAGFFDILWPGRFKGNPLDSVHTSTTSFGPGVTNQVAAGVASGKISQTTADQLVSGNATVGLGPGTFKYLTAPKGQAG